MRKFVLIISVMFLLVGCSLTNSPSKSVSELFKKYQSLDNSVLENLELITEGMDDLSSESERQDYRKVMKTQYSDLKYEIKDEDIQGDEAIVKVNISVYDYYKIQKEALDYRDEHQDEFLTEDVYDESKFLKYKLKNMMEASERVTYTIDVRLKKENNKWEVLEFDKDTLQKIHGVYDYERD